MQWNIPKIPILRKERLQEWAIPAIVVLVGLSAFGLGRLSTTESSQAALTLHGPTAGGVEQRVLPAAAAASAASLQTGAEDGAYVASKNGTKYYPLACSGASRINAENKVYFASAADATSAGYTLAAGCK